MINHLERAKLWAVNMYLPGYVNYGNTCMVTVGMLLAMISYSLSKYFPLEYVTSFTFYRTHDCQEETSA